MDQRRAVSLPGIIKGPLEGSDLELKVTFTTTTGLHVFPHMHLCLCRHEETVVVFKKGHTDIGQ